MSINDSGDVAYRGSAFSYEDLYAKTPTSYSIIFRGGDYNRDPSVPAINGSGLIAFSGDSFSVGFTEDMFAYANGQVTKIDSTSPAYIPNQITAPALNDKGEIAYARQRDEGPFDLILYRDGRPTVLPVTGALESLVQLNDAGTIAFYGVNAKGAPGVRTYNHGEVADVLGDGDKIFGKASQHVDVWDINESNQLALTVTFTDGSTAILIATPVPEPAAVVLGVAVILGTSIAMRLHCAPPRRQFFS